MLLTVFTNKKLITVDTITPLLLEAKAQAPGLRIEVYVPDQDDLETLRRNVVLFDALAGVASIDTLSGAAPGVGSPGARKLRGLLRLGRVVGLAMLGHAAILHFKFFSQGMTKWLAALARKRIILAQSAPFGRSPLHITVANLMKPRKNAALPIRADTVLLFTQGGDREMADVPGYAGRRILLDTPYRYPAWLRFLEGPGTDIWRGFLATNDIDTAAPIVAFSLSSFDNEELLHPTVRYRDLFVETLDTLLATNPGLHIVAKLHPATSTATAAFIEGEIRARSGRVHMCDLHPAVVARHARFAIGNGYSTTFGVYRLMGTPTVEYTLYRPDIAETTGGASARPELVDHFIARDVAALGDLCHRLTAGTPRSAPADARPVDLSPVLKLCGTR